LKHIDFFQYTSGRDVVSDSGARGHTLWGHCPWETVMKRYVDDKKLRFLAYHSDTCLETGESCYHVYCVFTNQVRCNTVLKLFPTAFLCLPVQGKLSHDPEYCSKAASFTKLGVEPAQGVQRKKRKISETEAVHGLESEFEIFDNQLKHLRREYDTTSQEKDKIVDDLKQQLETSKALAEEERKEAERIKTQLDIAAPAIIDQFRQAFISDCKA
jgi:hypothetical protein